MKLSEQLREYALLGDGEWLLQRAKEVAQLEAENEELLKTFEHYHRNNGINDACDDCGLDLRHPIHTSF